MTNSHANSALTAAPPVGVGLASLTEPADGLDRLEWLLDHRVEAAQIPLALRFGLAPETLDGSRRRRLTSLVGRFRRVTLHAPYHSVADVTFVSPSPAIVDASLAEVERVVALAADAGIEDVVVHSGRAVYWMTEAEVAERLRVALPRLQELAERHGVVFAMESAEWLASPPGRLRLVTDAALSRVRLCLDIGHLSTSPDGRPPLGDFASLAEVIDAFGPHTSVLHIHDTDGRRDHLPLGPEGQVDVDAVARALREVGFAGVSIQELAPVRIGPEEILASTRHVEAAWRRAWSAG